MVSYLDVATIESTSHLDGRLSLVNRGGLSVLLEPGAEVYLVPPKTDVIRAAHVASVVEVGPGRATINFREVDSIDVAEQLVGMHCLIEKDSVSSNDGLLDSAAKDLLAGWSFVDETSGFSGNVIRTWSASGNLLGEVALDGESVDRARLIPLADDFITDSNQSLKQLTLALPNGIFDL